jgi:DNA-binding NtrC family response regulator
MLQPSPTPGCLIVEDQALIGMALEAYLEELGGEVCGPFGTCAEAKSWLERHSPELGLLDYELKDGHCAEIAEILLGRGVPVAIYSGHPRGPDTPKVLQDVTWLEKPVARPELLRTLVRLAPSLAGQLTLPLS